MKQKLKLSFIALICVLFLITGCMFSKQTSVFRQMKNEADTLVVIGPYLEIEAYDFRKRTPDSVLADRSIEIITKVTTELLSSRYVLKHIEMPEIDRAKLLAFYQDADNEHGVDGSNRSQELFPDLKGIDKNTLAMFITCHAEYNSMITPVTGSSMFGTSSIGIAPAARPRTVTRLIVFNMQTDEIIFYNKYYTRNYSPQVSGGMEKITRKMLRDIYYK